MVSVEDKKTVCCPHCDAQSECFPITLIRKGSDELAALFQGVLNVIPCRDCGKSFVLDIPVTYCDADRRCLIHFMPAANLGNLDDALAVVKKLYENIFADIAETARPYYRLTTSRKNFIEKISIHHHGYDDRLIEYIKYQMFQHSQGLDPISMELLFDFANSSDTDIMFIAFARETGKPLYNLGFKSADYRELSERFLVTPEMEHELNALYQGVYVDVSQLL